MWRRDDASTDVEASEDAFSPIDTPAAVVDAHDRGERSELEFSSLSSQDGSEGNDPPDFVARSGKLHVIIAECCYPVLLVLCTE